METLPFPHIGETLRRLRRRRGKTIEELAAAAGSGKSQLSRIENRKQTPKLATVSKILKNLEISEEEFLQLYLAVARDERRLEEMEAGGGVGAEIPEVGAEEVAEPLAELGALLGSWPVKPRQGYLQFRDFLMTFNVVPLTSNTKKPS